MAEVALRATGVVKEYPSRRGPPVRALRGVSVCLPEARTLGVVGESGCGKSTLALSLIHILVEKGPTRPLFARPNHPYTQALLGSLPHRGTRHRQPLTQIGGSPPDPAHLGRGCPFRSRCPYAFDRCAEEEPPLIDRGPGAAACWKAPSEWEK